MAKRYEHNLVGSKQSELFWISFKLINSSSAPITSSSASTNDNTTAVSKALYDAGYNQNASKFSWAEGKWNDSDVISVGGYFGTAYLFFQYISKGYTSFNGQSKSGLTWKDDIVQEIEI